MMRFIGLFRIGLIVFIGLKDVQAQGVGVAGSPVGRVITEDQWVFRAGDSTGWANPAYNDNQWHPISPATNLDDNPTLWQTGRGWFRQTFRFRRFRNKDVTITIRQFGQSVVYLDGRPLAALKPVRYDSGGSQRIMAMLPVRIIDTNLHTLAVRYAFRRDLLIGRMIDKVPFQLDFGLSNEALFDLLDKEHTGSSLANVLIGLFGVLCLLHFLFYRANPTQPIHRVLGATMLAFALSLLIEQADNLSGTLTVDSLLNTIEQINVNAAFGLLLLSVYTYLGRQPGWPFWSLIALLTVSACYRILIGHLPDYGFIVLFALVLIEYIRVSWLAKRNNTDVDARLPWNSLKVTLYALLAIVPVIILFGLLAYLSKIGTTRDWIMVPTILLLLVSLFSVPLGLSLSLVRDYARTYLALRQKLDQVEQLSDQVLTQEKEKQQLLTRQNQTLEQLVADRTTELTQSLTELRATQQQLIQKEKLASLGELTAGIAHEIQNPLNFVNNFSEVSTELVDELRTGPFRYLPDSEKDYAGEIIGDLTQNLQRITQHGGRASAIVRGMLEHSRTNTGEKRPTDLNALADEYLKIAYHGVRAKNRVVDCELLIDFDPAVGQVEVMPQEIGRVLLNLFNNAFYAVSERYRQQPDSYTPTVTLATKRLNSTVEIYVRDNGTGIPEAIKSKIFQPFFTTKPAGEGTGLGLSLSYDIITMGHGGSLLVESRAGQGTGFVIGLPACLAGS